MKNLSFFIPREPVDVFCLSLTSMWLLVIKITEENVVVFGLSSLSHRLIDLCNVSSPRPV